METEQLAKKRHTCKDGTRHYKVFYWFGGWHFLTGQFGKADGKTVSQVRNKEGELLWAYPTSDLVPNDTKITDIWYEEVKDIPEKPWG